MVEMDKPLFTLTAFLAYTYTTLKSPSLVQSTPYAVITLKPFVNQRVWGKLWRLHGIFGKLCLYFYFFVLKLQMVQLPLNVELRLIAAAVRSRLSCFLQTVNSK